MYILIVNDKIKLQDYSYICVYIGQYIKSFIKIKIDTFIGHMVYNILYTLRREPQASNILSECLCSFILFSLLKPHCFKAKLFLLALRSLRTT